MPRRNPKNNMIRVRSYTRRSGQQVRSHRRHSPRNQQFSANSFSYGGYDYRIASRRSDPTRKLNRLLDQAMTSEEKVQILLEYDETAHLMYNRMGERDYIDYLRSEGLTNEDIQLILNIMRL